MLRWAAIIIGLGGLAGTWWTWWAVATGHPLEFRWWVEVYIEPFVILFAFGFALVVLWEESKSLLKRKG